MPRPKLNSYPPRSQYGNNQLICLQQGVVSSRAGFIVRLRLADGRLAGARTTREQVCNWGGQRTTH